jgi:haloacetate dehalogenase
VAADLAQLMAQLGHDTFHVCGHDRGGRVAHRLALDHPQRVKKLCVLDIAPTLDMYAATDMAFARAYYHWFHLIQPAPLPETMIGADPQAVPAHRDG